MPTGAALSYGGSLARTEATGYGLIYFVQEYLNCHDDSFEGKTVAVSGSGNVAIYATSRIISSSWREVWSLCRTPPAGSTTWRASTSTS